MLKITNWFTNYRVSIVYKQMNTIVFYWIILVFVSYCFCIVMSDQNVNRERYLQINLSGLQWQLALRILHSLWSMTSSSIFYGMHSTIWVAIAFGVVLVAASYWMELTRHILWPRSYRTCPAHSHFRYRPAAFRPTSARFWDF